MHLRPIYFDDFYFNSVKIDSIAKANNKQVVISDCWLYKCTQEELQYGTVLPDSIFCRDVFSNYAVVDSMFINSVYKLSNLIKSPFTSFYKSQYFFGYLLWNKADSVTYSVIPAYKAISLVDNMISQNITNDVLSASGNVYKDILNLYCGNSVSIITNNFPVNDLNVFPNPSHGPFTAELNLSQSSDVNMYIIDIQGRIIKTVLNTRLDRGNYSFNLNCSDLSDGMYYLILNDQQSRIYKKIIISKY